MRMWVPALRSNDEEALHRVRDTIVEHAATQGSHDLHPLISPQEIGHVVKSREVNEPREGGGSS
jgi:hypothetical protein